MHANGYDGFNDLYRPGGIHEAACMAMFAAGPATGTPACGLPPASAYVWVLEGPA
jgi:hypothetical protein